MDNNQRGMLILIKSALTGEKFSLPDDFSLEKAYELCKKRHLLSMLYTGAVRCGISRQDPLMLKMFQYYFRYLKQSEKQMQELKILFEAFDNASIDYFPVKGTHLKTLYPKPEFRMMGDADILIRTEQYDKIQKLLLSLGFEHDSDCDHHFAWHKGNLQLELHSKLVSNRYKEFYTYYGTGWQLAIPVSGTQYQFRTPEDEFIYLFTHFTKHYRFGGIGCRHVIDLWVYRNSYKNLDEAYILSVFEQLKLTEFYQNIMRLLRVWFEDELMDAKSEFITEFIFSSGNWGTTASHALADSVLNRHTIKHSRFYRLHKFMKLLFPGKENLMLRYPFLRKYPYLYLFFYPIRIVDTLLTRRKNIKKHMSGISYSTPDKVLSFEQSLAYVGLKFHK